MRRSPGAVRGPFYPYDAAYLTGNSDRERRCVRRSRFAPGLQRACTGRSRLLRWRRRAMCGRPARKCRYLPMNTVHDQESTALEGSDSVR